MLIERFLFNVFSYVYHDEASWSFAFHIVLIKEMIEYTYIDVFVY